MTTFMTASKRSFYKTPVPNIYYLMAKYDRCETNLSVSRLELELEPVSLFDFECSMKILTCAKTLFWARQVSVDSCKKGRAIPIWKRYR